MWNWFTTKSSSSNSTNSNFSNSTASIYWNEWFHNGTFNVDEFNEDLTNTTDRLENHLHPASDVDINGIRSMLLFNVVVFVGLMVAYEILRRCFPYVYANRHQREAKMERFQHTSNSNNGDGNRSTDGHGHGHGDGNGDGHGLDEEDGANNNNNNAGQSSFQNNGSRLPDLEWNSPLQWVKPVFGVSWKQVRAASGLDAYFYLRYIRMCFRITSVSAFWGMAILFPIFYLGKNGASGWYHFSMANVEQGNPVGIWVPTIFMYLFSAFVFFIMKQEYKHYVELRLDFLGKGDTDYKNDHSTIVHHGQHGHRHADTFLPPKNKFKRNGNGNASNMNFSPGMDEKMIRSNNLNNTDHQHHYSVMVENIPSELRSDRALFDYFDKMFPSRVHSANVILNCKDLCKLSTKKSTVTQRLEKGIAFYEATSLRLRQQQRQGGEGEGDGLRPSHIHGRPRFMLCGIEMFGPYINYSCCRPFCHDHQGKNNNIRYDFDDQDDAHVAKGERVDSINFYTHELKRINKIMFVKQKHKRDIAAYGNGSLRANSWFSKVSEFAQFFMDDPNEEDSDAEDEWDNSSRCHSTVWNEDNHDANGGHVNGVYTGTGNDTGNDNQLKHHNQNRPTSIGFTGSDLGSTEDLHKIQKEKMVHIQNLRSNSLLASGSNSSEENDGVHNMLYDDEVSGITGPTTGFVNMEQCIVGKSTRRGLGGGGSSSNGQAQTQIKATSPTSPKFNYGSTNDDSGTDDPNAGTPSKKRRWMRGRGKLLKHKEKSVKFRKNMPSDNGSDAPSDFTGSSGSGDSKSKPLMFRRKPPSKNPLLQYEHVHFGGNGNGNGNGNNYGAQRSLSSPVTILRNRHTSARRPERAPSIAACIGDEKTAKKISKAAGRLGLDFGAYAMKLIHRTFSRTMEDENKNMTMSKTGFVTFLDLGSVTCVASAPLTHKPNTLNVNVAPQRRDIIWENAHFTTESCARREITANNFLFFGALLWSIPLALIQAMSSAENVARMPGMEWILEYDNGNLAVLVNAYLPVVGFLGLIMILPIIFEWVAYSYERRKTRSDVEQSVVSRYFYYQLANIYISVTAGSLWKSAADIIERPSYGLEILGNSLPTVVGYFIALIITKILGGLPLVMLRLGALGRYMFLRLVTREDNLTQRELDQVYREEPLLYGWEYPTQLLIIIICFTYACISPVILIFGALYFLGALMVYKKQILYVYTPKYESGGALFPVVCDRTIIGLICGQLTFIGYSTIRGGHYQPMALVPLVYFSFWTMNWFRIHFAEPSNRLTLERAKDLDEQVRIQGQKADPENNPLIPQNSFNKDHYKQPILTEKHGRPFFYRLGREDELTKQARLRLSGGERADMWMGLDSKQIEAGRRGRNNLVV